MASTNPNLSSRARVDLIDGFLGAGKTTFIQRYVRYLENAGISYVVLENEFGTAGVDARMLSGNVQELAGGCICCGLKVNFHDTLVELAHHVERIIVEPSGIFNADDFFDIMDSPRVKEVAECGMMAGVVDPFALENLSETDERVLYSELISAGAILVSRTDQADEAAVSAACETLKKLLGTLPPVMDARTAPIEELMSCAPVRREHIRMRENHASLFQCAALYPEDVYDADGIRRLADALFSGEAGEVLRIKGALRSKDAALLVNATKNSVDIAPCEGDAVLNVIGHNLRRRVIRKYLSDFACTK